MRQSQAYRQQFLARWLLALGISLLVGACAAIEKVAVEQAQQEVSERAQQRWNYVTKGQIEKAYEFLSPASRSTVSIEAFRKRSAGGRWHRSMKLEKVDCSADTCRVTMVVDYDLHEIKGLKRSIEETWIKDAGTWWLVAGK